MASYCSIPTPPFSPNSPMLPPLDADNPLRSTIELLDTLVAFYQRERMWVYRTRAMMEEAFDGPQPLLPSAPQENSLPSPSPSSSPSPSESDTQDTKPVVLCRPKQLSTRWMRRKKSFHLKLEGISKPSKLPRKVRKPETPDSVAKEHILQLFEKLMEDRMESCQRVSKLVRSANRTYLHP